MSCLRHGKGTLACIWLIKDSKKFPTLNGSHVLTEQIRPTFLSTFPQNISLMGSYQLLTVINVICIFMTAVLKIKEVAVPYTSSPDLKRWVRYTSSHVAHEGNGSMKYSYDNFSLSMLCALRLLLLPPFITMLSLSLSAVETSYLLHSGAATNIQIIFRAPSFLFLFSTSNYTSSIGTGEKNTLRFEANFGSFE